MLFPEWDIYGENTAHLFGVSILVVKSKLCLRASGLSNLFSQNKAAPALLVIQEISLPFKGPRLQSLGSEFAAWEPKGTEWLPNNIEKS